MYVRHILLVAALAFSSLALSSEIVTREINSAALNRVWKYNVYLPTGYESGDKKYPVL
jgi:predicted alpha/beta superfamily hydrolase